MTSDRVLETVRREAVPLVGHPDELRPLIAAAAADARVVLIGEASHGTHEFYRTRAELTKALIRDHDFNIVAVEADWPDAYRVNRWVRLASQESGPAASLDDFTRFPRWMWRDRDVVAFVEWLRDDNDSRPAARAGLGARRRLVPPPSARHVRRDAGRDRARRDRESLIPNP